MRFIGIRFGAQVSDGAVDDAGRDVARLRRLHGRARSRRRSGPADDRGGAPRRQRRASRPLHDRRLRPGRGLRGDHRDPAARERPGVHAGHQRRRRGGRLGADLRRRLPRLSLHRSRRRAGPGRAPRVWRPELRDGDRPRRRDRRPRRSRRRHRHPVRLSLHAGRRPHRALPRRLLGLGPERQRAGGRPLARPRGDDLAGVPLVAGVGAAPARDARWDAQLGQRHQRVGSGGRQRAGRRLGARRRRPRLPLRFARGAPGAAGSQQPREDAGMGAARRERRQRRVRRRLRPARRAEPRLPDEPRDRPGRRPRHARRRTERRLGGRPDRRRRRLGRQGRAHQRRGRLRCWARRPARAQRLRRSVAGWELQQANGINSHGAIVGMATHQGVPVGFKLTLPLCRGP